MSGRSSRDERPLPIFSDAELGKIFFFSDFKSVLGGWRQIFPMNIVESGGFIVSRDVCLSGVVYRFAR